MQLKLLRTAAVMIEELCQSVRSENSEESGDSDEDGDEEPPNPPIPGFGEAV